MVLLTVGGHFLDGKLGTEPFLTLAGAGLGFGAGLYQLYRVLYVRKKK